MARDSACVSDCLAFGEDGWSLTITGDEPRREGWASTLLALSNGSIGVRGSVEERAHATTFLARAYEQGPILYHERLAGFAATTDTRVPVAEALGLDFVVDGEPLDLTRATSQTRRTLDLRSGILRRHTRWLLEDGRTLTVETERLVPLDGRTVLVRRLRASLLGASVRLEPRLAPAPRAAAQSDDPRIGVNLGSAGFVTERHTRELLVERLAGSGTGVATVQRQQEGGDWLLVTTGFAVGREHSDLLAEEAAALAQTALEEGFERHAAKQAERLGQFWAAAAVDIRGQRGLSAALRVNLFHLFASAGRDGCSGAAAKGLTGEGYEGHVFWDTEAFVVPVLAVLAPEVARALLIYRSAMLDAAVANARALDHERGALFAWRTIEGRECSAHYPSGSAQYHVNAAVAFAIGFYVDATGDEGFLVEHGARVLIETARLWLDLGHYDASGFHLRGVTGPDEYTALVDDNWYTNRMAQKHLRLAASAARKVAEIAPDAWARLVKERGIADGELREFERAADAMVLPFDAVRDLDAQDSSFLDKPRWTIAGPAQSPLLLHHHPMTLYRHQVSKQADIVLGMVLGGEEVSLERKRRVFAHYEPLTTHDSTLSASSHSILASEVGDEPAALRFFGETTLIDLEDRHGNTAHGVHMAALAGSWLALIWGFAGFRPSGPELRFAISCPAEWGGYQFGMRWRGSLIEVSVERTQVTYSCRSGPPISIGHRGTSIRLSAGETWTGPWFE